MGIAIGATSSITAILAKLQCYYKMNSEYPCGCGFTETQIADNDDVHINRTTVNGVDLLYVGKRKSTDDEIHETRRAIHDEDDDHKAGCIFG